MLEKKLRSVGRIPRIAAGAFLCIFLCVFCGCVKDQAYPVFEEAQETEEQTAELAGEERRDGLSIVQEAGREPMICVYVCGAVNSPGVVELEPGSRARDALLQAGGFLEEAATEAVNLAGVLTDGQMLYFPTKDEYQKQVAEQADRDNGLVNINTADVARLCTLPGIGEARASAIIEYREANGVFATIEEIKKVSGIGEAAYDKIKQRISVD